MNFHNTYAKLELPAETTKSMARNLALLILSFLRMSFEISYLWVLKLTNVKSTNAADGEVVEPLQVEHEKSFLLASGNEMLFAHQSTLDQTKITHVGFARFLT